MDGQAPRGGGSIVSARRRKLPSVLDDTLPTYVCRNRVGWAGWVVGGQSGQRCSSEESRSEPPGQRTFWPVALGRGEVDALYDTCINAALARREWGIWFRGAHKPVISTANVWSICDLAVLDLWSAADPCVADGFLVWRARPFCA